jgi:hypothetical protein
MASNRMYAKNISIVYFYDFCILFTAPISRSLPVRHLSFIAARTEQLHPPLQSRLPTQRPSGHRIQRQSPPYP